MEQGRFDDLSAYSEIGKGPNRCVEFPFRSLKRTFLVIRRTGGDDVEAGLVIGAGTDVKLSHSLSLGMEGLYYFFDDGGDGAIINASTGNPVSGLDDDTEFGVVRARLTYHLGSQPLAPLK